MIPAYSIAIWMISFRWWCRHSLDLHDWIDFVVNLQRPRFYQVNHLKFHFNRWKLVWVILFIGILAHIIFAVCDDDDDDDGLLCGIIVLCDLFVCTRLYENLCTYHIVYQKLSNIWAISLIRTKLQIRFERRKYKHIACANIPFAMLCCVALRCVVLCV